LAQNDSPGAVFTLNNAVDVNRVVAYARDASGGLSVAASYPTGGKGLGANLGSQGALALTANGRWLLAVNAGSNDLSVFSVRDGSLVLTDVVPSGGRRPISVTVEDNLVYVLNAGGAAGATDNISGFFLSQQGRLVAVPGATRSLSAGDVGPAQVSFGLRGDVVVVTEKASNRLCGFPIDDQGRAGPAVTTPSSGATPFGFGVSSKGYIFVSEAPGSALSSYQLHADGSLGLVTASLANHQAAACWAVVSKNEKYAYTANAGNNTISAYQIALDGSVRLLSSVEFTAAADVHPIDMAVSNNGQFLYSLNNTSGTIIGFRLNEDGRLTRVSHVAGLPASTVGLIAR
jgi:6-phosphogluconolactonase (cycloisomerase 2 family)